MKYNSEARPSGISDVIPPERSVLDFGAVLRFSFVALSRAFPALLWIAVDFQIIPTERADLIYDKT